MFDSIIYPGQEVSFLVYYGSGIINPVFNIYKSDDISSTSVGSGTGVVVSASLIRYSFTVPISADIGDTFQILASGDTTDPHIVFSGMVYLPIDNISDFNESLNQIAFIFKDHSNNAISNVRVSIKGVLRSGVSNTDGIVYFYVEDDADYTFNISPPPFFQTPDQVVVTVTNQDLVEPIILDPVVLDDGRLCNVLFEVHDQHGNPIAGAKIYTLIKDGPAFAQSFLLNQNWVYTTDQFGQVIIPMIRATSFNQGEGIYKVKIQTPFAVKEFDYSAPDEDTATVITSL